MDKNSEDGLVSLSLEDAPARNSGTSADGNLNVTRDSADADMDGEGGEGSSAKGSSARTLDDSAD